MENSKINDAAMKKKMLRKEADEEEGTMKKCEDGLGKCIMRADNMQSSLIAEGTPLV